MDAKVVQIDYLPMYNQDLESPLPPGVARFKAEIEQADGLLIVTPEHNRSLPAVLKNAIDWGARPYGRNSWAGKPVAIAGTSPGAMGTAIAQQHLRQILGDLGALVMGGEAYISFKPGLINDSGAITDEGTRKFTGLSCPVISNATAPQRHDPVLSAMACFSFGTWARREA